MICPPLHITFLGTGTSSGVPMICCNCEVCTSSNYKDTRLRSSILIQSSTTTIVIDTTPDFRQQMLRAKVRNIDAILFTHPHKDHVAGLDDIRAYNYFLKKPIDVYANTLTQEALKKEFSYIFSDVKYVGIPDISLHIIPDAAFFIGDIPIVPIKVWHHNMPVLAFRFGDFTYITDANKIENDEMRKIMNSTILVINALRHEKHISHFSLSEAINVADEVKSLHTYFTHISHQMGLHETINAQLPKGMQLAYDDLVIVSK